MVLPSPYIQATVPPAPAYNYMCQFCMKHFKSRLAWKRHKADSHGPRMQCGTCKFTCPVGRPGEMRKHLQRKHGVETGSPFRKRRRQSSYSDLPIVNPFNYRILCECGPSNPEDTIGDVGDRELHSIQRSIRFLFIFWNCWFRSWFRCVHWWACLSHSHLWTTCDQGIFGHFVKLYVSASFIRCANLFIQFCGSALDFV